MRERVLVVDDDQKTYEVISHLFLTYQPATLVTFCQNGTAALELLQNKSFDLVLTDCRMPEMNGQSLIMEIRKSNSNIPIILMHEKGEEPAKCCQDTVASSYGANSIIEKKNLPDLYANFMADDEERWGE